MSPQVIDIIFTIFLASGRGQRAPTGLVGIVVKLQAEHEWNRDKAGVEKVIRNANERDKICGWFNDELGMLVGLTQKHTNQ